MQVVKTPKDEIVVVCGLGRCGSTLVMRMLQVGGYKLYYSQPKTFETIDMFKLEGKDYDASWLDNAKGAAFKLLDPHVYALPKGPAYKFIFISRNLREQAKSQVKLIKGHVKERIGRAKTREIERVMDREEFMALKEIRSFKSVGLFVSFESILNDPKAAAIRIAEFVGADLDIMAMASAVVDRSPKNYDGFLKLDY